MVYASIKSSELKMLLRSLKLEAPKAHARIIVQSNKYFELVNYPVLLADRNISVEIHKCLPLQTSKCEKRLERLWDRNRAQCKESNNACHQRNFQKEFDKSEDILWTEKVSTSQESDIYIIHIKFWKEWKNERTVYSRIFMIFRTTLKTF